ncbi:MAG: prolipoprotein diacylglyceryl transferase [Calditrichia bacterium]
MYPELFRIGPFSVQSYGVMLALSFVLGILIAVRMGRQRGINSDKIINLGYIIIISSIIGARLFYVLFHLPEFRGRWLYTFWPVQENGLVGLGGLILLGGFITAFISSTLYIRFTNMKFLKVADCIAPAIALGVFLTRIGCFLNGCCFGRSCDLAWGIHFPPDSPAGAVMGDASLHPTQLYSSLYGIIIFVTLLFLNRKRRPDGFLIGLFLVLYGISRFTVDFFRHYEGQMYIAGGLEFNQLVSLFMVAGGFFILFLPKQSSERRRMQKPTDH